MIASLNFSNALKITARHISCLLRQETPRPFYFLTFYPTSISVYQLTSCYVPQDFNIYQRRCGELQIRNTFKSKNIEVGLGNPRKSSSAVAYVSSCTMACKTWVAPHISFLVHSTHLSDKSPRILLNPFSASPPHRTYARIARLILRKLLVLIKIVLRTTNMKKDF